MWQADIFTALHSENMANHELLFVICASPVTASGCRNVTKLSAARFAFSHNICQLQQIRWLQLAVCDATVMLLSAFVLSRLDYCNACLPSCWTRLFHCCSCDCMSLFLGPCDPKTTAAPLAASWMHHLQI